ncbi:beta-1,4 N-acetylgalactosaminyltransferase 2-like [Gouania willdenowi]|uniref:beta-1,4 N-acetylgalactosaminyltransferase 2-like n=1 Tax=Gouania willdenowi TaxID=441366 RepID=UPI00105609D9|nr:beta-1,4 N-acetylgalactosaminyltransferase 2-like [Gouania willdenowi]
MNFVLSRSQFQVLGVACLVMVTSMYVVMFSVSLERFPRKILTLHNEPYIRSQRSMQSLDPSSCLCYPDAVTLSSRVPMMHYGNMVQRRAQEFKSYKIRKFSVLSTPLHAKANSPLQYPIHGYIVLPLTPTLIPDLALHAEEKPLYKVSLKVSKGVLKTKFRNEEATVTGLNENKLMIESSSLEVVNQFLSEIVYTSIIYHIKTADQAHFQFENYEAVFPIVIKQPQVPVLWKTTADIDSLVTITTKTFLRYPKLKIMVESVRTFYPKIHIVIADDNIRTETIPGRNIEQFYMPPAKGWFAGRNLAVSQVNTKYFMWVDDDYLFTEKTKIEKFVEVLEANPELDMVGGSVGGNRWDFTFLYNEGDDEEGGCMYLKFHTQFHPLPGYPNCSLVNGVVNFFLARTDAVRSIGFDPVIKRVGHPELFMDGLGYLMVATCDDPENMHINHQPHAENGVSYNKFRHPANKYMDYRYPIYYFKNHMKCIRL